MKLHFNVTSILLNIFKIILQTVSQFLIPILIFILVILLLCFYWYMYFRVFDKIKPKQKKFHSKIKKVGFIKKIFYQFPRQLSLDILNKDPDSFNEFGIHMFCGMQGAGKTITAVWFIREWQRKYPAMKCYSNIDITDVDGRLNSWKDLILHENGVYGIVNFYDEIHTAFSSKDSKDVPPSLLAEISYQRKQKKALLMTAQVFGRVAKPLREQVTFLYLPKTYFNVLTIVRKVDPINYDSQTNKFGKTKGLFFFVHDKELRDSYNTYEKVAEYVNTDFVPSIYAGTSSSSDEESGI